MKKLFISMAMLASTACFAGQVAKPSNVPLWEEDKHFCYYRTLCIEGSTSNLDCLLKEFEKNPQDYQKYIEAMKWEVQNIKNALGFPQSDE